jgi:hypothetical protein
MKKLKKINDAVNRVQHGTHSVDGFATGHPPKCQRDDIRGADEGPVSPHRTCSAKAAMPGIIFFKYSAEKSTKMLP